MESEGYGALRLPSQTECEIANDALTGYDLSENQ